LPILDLQHGSYRLRPDRPSAATFPGHALNEHPRPGWPLALYFNGDYDPVVEGFSCGSLVQPWEHSRRLFCTGLLNQIVDEITICSAASAARRSARDTGKDEEVEMAAPSGYARVDGLDDECARCERPLQYAAGESLVDGRNHWFLETRCLSCGIETLECGRDLPPEPVRSKLLELTGCWVATIGSSPATPVMRALRKVYGGTIVETRELAGWMRDGGLHGTRGELVLLQAELATLGVHTSIANTAPGAQDQLPDRPAPAPPHRIGRPPTLSAELVPDAIAETERSQVAAYLRGAHCIVATTSGYWTDPITRDPRDRIRDAVMTDGVYIWSIAWATLVERHGLGLPDDFLTHARTLGYRPPELTAEQLHLAAIEVGLGDPESQ
jgi:hypothetical protein